MFINLILFVTTVVFSKYFGNFVRRLSKLWPTNHSFPTGQPAIFGGLNMIKKVGSLFNCDENSPTVASDKYAIDAGSKMSKSEVEKNKKVNQSIAAANSATSAIDGITGGLNNFESNYGQWSIFGSKINEAGNHGIGNCYTGNVFACGAPKVEIFGGAGGRGAAGEVILGKFVDNLDKDNIYGDLKRTGSILGVNITSPGEGYLDAPLISCLLYTSPSPRD